VTPDGRTSNWLASFPRCMCRTQLRIPVPRRGEDVRTIGRELQNTSAGRLIAAFGNKVAYHGAAHRHTPGFHVWSHSYEQVRNDVLAVQEDIARQGGGQPRAAHSRPRRQPVSRPQEHSAEGPASYLLAKAHAAKPTYSRSSAPWNLLSRRAERQIRLPWPRSGWRTQSSERYFSAKPIEELRRKSNHCWPM